MDTEIRRRWLGVIAIGPSIVTNFDANSVRTVFVNFVPWRLPLSRIGAFPVSGAEGARGVFGHTGYRFETGLKLLPRRGHLRGDWRRHLRRSKLIWRLIGFSVHRKNFQPEAKHERGATKQGSQAENNHPGNGRGMQLALSQLNRAAKDDPNPDGNC